MKSFWDEQKEGAIATKERRAMTMAKNKCNPDFNVAHVDETRDAQTNNYTKLKNRIQKDIKGYQDKQYQRRLRLAGKQ